MAKKINQHRNKNTKINPEAYQKNISYDECSGRLAFLQVCDKHCLLSDWQNKELKLLLDCFKKIESMSWKQIKKDAGLQYETIKNVAIKPPILPPDVTFKSLRVNQAYRLYGYRAQDTFNIVWFDKNHIVCPVNKPKRYVV